MSFTSVGKLKVDLVFMPHCLVKEDNSIMDESRVFGMDFNFLVIKILGRIYKLLHESRV